MQTYFLPPPMVYIFVSIINKILFFTLKITVNWHLIALCYLRLYKVSQNTQFASSSQQIIELTLKTYLVGTIELIGSQLGLKVEVLV